MDVVMMMMPVEACISHHERSSVFCKAFVLPGRGFVRAYFAWV